MNRAIALIAASLMFCGLLIVLFFGFGFVMLFVNTFATGAIPGAIGFTLVASTIFYLGWRSLKLSRWVNNQIEQRLNTRSARAESSKRFRASDVELDMAKAYMDETSEDYDIAKAIELLKKGAVQDHSEAQTELAKIYLTEDVSEFFASEDEATAAAIRLLAEASDKGFAPAQTELADLYSTGSGVALDWPKALDLYRRSAGKGNSVAQYELARALLDGKHIAKSEKGALGLLLNAASQNLPEAQEMLGFMHLRGVVVEQSREVAISYYRAAASNGSESARRQVNQLSNNPPPT